MDQMKLIIAWLQCLKPGCLNFRAVTICKNVSFEFLQEETRLARGLR
jgi:hypothetical protein